VVLHHSSKVFQVQELTVAKGGFKGQETSFDPNAPDPKALDANAAGPAPPGAPAGIVATGGKLAGGGPPPPGPLGLLPLDKNGIPQLNKPGLIMMMTMGPNGPAARMVGKAQSMSDLANMVGNQLNQPVVDKTSLTGKYDFTLEFAPDLANMRLRGPGPGAGPGPGPGGGPGDFAGAPSATDPSGLTLTGALQQQLGLRLVPNKAPLDLLVIDQINKTPTEN
jgi:uncharacterized protein (TIGR03435 family)